MDALTLLIADHNRMRGLFKQFRSAHEADDPERMGSLALTIFEELEVHTAIEEEIFYPWVRDFSAEIGDEVDEGLQEHHVVKVLMDEANRLDVATHEWVAKLTVIVENVQHHAGEEEDDLFPHVRTASSAEDRRILGQRIDERKRSLGASTVADKIDLTTNELSRLARAQEIPGRSKMNHDELAATVALR